MTRSNPAQIQFDALTLEGSLLPAEWLAKVAALEAPSQAPADYGIPRGLQLRDEIGRYWRVAQAVWADFASSYAGAHAEAATLRLARELLTQVFGFADLTPAGERIAAGRAFSVAFEAIGDRVPVVVGLPSEDLDLGVVRHGGGGRRRSAWSAAQEYLNAADWAMWGIATNGLTLRIGRDNASLTRPAWLEADLARIFAEQRFADFSVLWLVLHRSRFGRADRPLKDCPLEQWRDVGREEGSRARKVLRVGVEKALLALGRGFLAHPANGSLRGALAGGAILPAQLFNELLRLVYRMIFLLTVEERNILHDIGASADAVQLYTTGYSMRRLRQRSVRHAAHDQHADLWLSLRLVFDALGRAAGEPILGLPGLGGLFASRQCPHVDDCAIANRALLTAVFHLAWIREGDALVRVNWKDMGVEELGSVYESLLELVPIIRESGRQFAFAERTETGGHERKLTGSYYTPDTLVQQLLDTALEPVITAVLAQYPDPSDAEREFLALSIVDPACGSGHFLLGAARRLAGHLSRLRAGGTAGTIEYRHALRDVVTHCIYGVDRNPMAVELTRMALWLEAHSPDRALGFLDHHLVCGDALVGLLDLRVLHHGIPDKAYKALTGDSKAVVKTLAKLNRQGRKALADTAEDEQLSLVFGSRSLAQAFAQLDALVDDQVVTVEAKQAQYAALQTEVEKSPLALAADCFVAAFLLPKQLPPGTPALTDAQVAERWPTTATLGMVLDATLTDMHPVVTFAMAVCDEALVFHWPLAFPQVFARGGFDVVLGNPPWERLKLQEQEFFAQRAPHVAYARNTADRAREIALLKNAEIGTPERAVYDAFQRAKQLVEAAAVFGHTEARYPLTGVGDLNTYALFAETMYRIAAPTGRAGMVVPTGIATDNTTKEFFGDLVQRSRLASLFDFENRTKLFSSVDSRLKFCLLTIGDAKEPECAFFATDVAQLKDERRRFRLAQSDFRLLNPNTGTSPICRTGFDAELTKSIYRRVPIFVNESQSEFGDQHWCISFLRMFDMSSDSGLFLDAPVADAVPLYEAKMVHQFDHRWATYVPMGNNRASDPHEATLAQRMDPEFVVQPRYWVPISDVQARLTAHGWTRQWLMGWRDICRSTDERTVIASVIPRVGAGDKLLLILPDASPKLAACLLADQNSMVHDYIARQKLGSTSLKYYTKMQLTNIPPDAYTQADIAFIVPRVLELTYTACDLAGWAHDLGLDRPPFAWGLERRAVLRAEIDAYYARLYGLTREELRYVLNPTDVKGPDFPSETFRVLEKNDMRYFGEYRTRRLVLEAWDRLSQA